MDGVLFDIFTLPVVAIFDNVAFPVTPSVPDAVILLRDVSPTTVKLPLFVVFANVVIPVTPSVLLNVAAPVDPKVPVIDPPGKVDFRTSKQNLNIFCRSTTDSLFNQRKITRVHNA